MAPTASTSKANHVDVEAVVQTLHRSADDELTARSKLYTPWLMFCVLEPIKEAAVLRCSTARHQDQSTISGIARTIDSSF